MKNKLNFLDKIHQIIKSNPQNILLPEADIDDRVFQASMILAKHKYCRVSVIGNSQSLINKYQKAGFSNLEDIQIFDMQANNQDVIKYANDLYLKRKHKGLTQEEAFDKMQNINYFACSLLMDSKVDGVVTGATFTTKEVFQPAIQIIGSKQKNHKISSYFIMLQNQEIYYFADCAVNINPDSQTLAQIAIDTSLSAKLLGIQPSVAFLSFSTNNSAQDPNISKIQEALKIVNKTNPELEIDGEMQVDSALIPEIRSRKYPNSKLTQPANILIFPDLNSGNIAYKLVERIAKAKAIGPILQGLNKPLNDLSRGCSIQDIVEISALTAFESINHLG